MQNISINFIASFKLGDNVAYNLKVLATLYEQRAAVSDSKAKHFNKPLILLNASITEAILYDFIFRVKNFTREGVASLPKKIIEHFRTKKVDRLELYIVHFNKHELFDDAAFPIFEKLDELRKLRNRIHIQNEKKELEPNDKDAFTNERLHLSEQCLEFTLKTLSKNHARPIDGHVVAFILPFDAHFEFGKAPRSSTTLFPNT